ncbi:DEAD/DEAH box helicase [Nitriliruptoraceae bacterium ZYF776]|nr:DEAD/DEAH box helicase [Profundirhabdus halotolerans]
MALLEAHRSGWIDALRWLRRQVVATLGKLDREVTGPERDLVLTDFREERDRIDAVLGELTGETPDAPSAPVATTDDEGDGDEEQEAAERAERRRVGTALLQLSWHRGRLIAWAGNEGAEPEPVERVRERLAAAGVGTDPWVDHDERLKLPDGTRVDALSAPVETTLGWLVSLLAPVPDEEDDGPDLELAPSVTWMGLAAGLAVRLVAHGRVVPQLQKVADAPGNRSDFAVRWEPTLIDHDELIHLTRSMPGAVAVLERQRDPKAVTRAVVSGLVDAICRDAARRVEVPAPPPHPRTASDIAEAVLGRLDGSSFEAPHQQGSEVGKALKGWAAGVTGAAKLELIVQLDPPDEGDAWLLRTLTSDGRRKDENVEAAMSRAKHDRKEAIKRELERLEGLYTPLERGKDTRRGQVILSQDEAWDLMTTTGPMLQSAGFEVRVPPLSTKKATPQLRVTSTESQEAAVGAQQLSSVRWSAVFDDVELTAEDIQRLAGESRPLVKSHGRWVEVDHADLEAAAAALAERADRTKLTGAEMLRFALGLDGTALGNPVSVAGEGWAAELLRSASEIPEHPPTRPEGFEGELRSYQANALAWLGFLDQAGLGGCLALDMGLGKTPTMLAHLRATRSHGPALVIAPPAVVGNWAAEADRFVGDLDVRVHHGARRADTSQLAAEVRGADVLLTTYGTAVRDIEALVEVEWGKVVLDEAQVIKNPASETAQQLRRLDARTRVVLTGTPIENGLGDLWALMDFVNPGLVGERATFVAQMQKAAEGTSGAESALKTLNGVLVFRRTKAEPVIAAELPDRIDALDHCPMTPEQIGLYQAVLDELVAETADTDDDAPKRKGAVLAAITALKQICNHPANYTGDDEPLAGRSGKLARLEEIVDNVFDAGERLLIFTHFASWGERLATHLTERTGQPISCYHGGLARGARDKMVAAFQEGTGPGALVLSLKAGGTGLNLTAASHVVLYDRWWNPAVEDQARDRVWRIGQTKTVVAHRLVCPGTVDERVEEVVAGKRRIADLALPKSSSVGDLDSAQLRRALGIDPDLLLTDETAPVEEGAA